MLKIIPPRSYDFQEQPVQPLRVSSRGLVGTDKRAAEDRCGDVFLATLRRDPPQKDEMAIHVIALGDGEHFGPNRNGDYFSKEACRKYHDTFVKHARWYRGHANKDPARSYGIVKKSYYNPKAGRIELLVYLNAAPSAARRNGGKVADMELEKLASGEELPVSMATRVPYDVCSGCGNRAATRAEYCNHTVCVKYGGLQENIGKTFEDGHTLCALNPVCDWFDISAVVKPADRIAYTLGVYQAVKEASADGRVKCGAELAEELELAIPSWYIKTAGIGQSVEQHKILEKLAEYEKLVEKSPEYRKKLQEVARLFCQDLHGLPTFDSEEQKAAFMTALTKCAGLLSPPAFFKLLGIQAGGNLSGMYRRVLNEPDVLSILECNPYLAINEKQAQQTLKADTSRFSILPALFSMRPGGEVKTASYRTGPRLAREYVLYQLASLLSHQGSADFGKMLAVAASAAVL